MEKIEKFLEQAGLSHFDEVKPLRDLSAKVGVKPSVLLAGLLVLVIIFVAFECGAYILTSGVGFLYPAYMSMKAIETKDNRDDTQWLTFWVVYAVCTIFDPLINFLLFFLPFYYLFKLAFYIYLFHPKTRGAETIYNLGVKKLLKKVEVHVENVEKGFVGEGSFGGR